MNGLYHHPPTWLHGVAAGYKLAVLAALSIFIFRIASPVLLIACVLALIVLYMSLGCAVTKRLSFFTPLLPILVIIFVAQYFTGGFGAALMMVCRLLLMLALADLVTMSTPMQAMMDAVTPLLSPLKFAGANTEKLSFAVALTVRLVPLLLENWRGHAQAFRARTGKPANWRVLAPFIANSLRLADQMGEALDARGFGSGSTRQTRENAR